MNDINIKKLIISKIKTTKLALDKKTAESGRQLKAFSIIFFINYPLYYIIWTYGAKQSYENLPLRLSASFLCLLLMLRKYWPKFLKSYVSLYWYFLAMYCLPFFFIFMTLKNNVSTAWLLNLFLALLLLFLLFDISSLFFLSAVGTILATVFYKLTTVAPLAFHPGSINFFAAAATILAALIVGGIFAHNREKIESTKLKTMMTVGASIAHELRTPLATIRLSASGVREFLPTLIAGYQQAVKSHLVSKKIGQKRLGILEECADNIELEANSASAFVDILLMNVGQFELEKINISESSIEQTIKEALNRYPFKPNQKKLVHCQSITDFTYWGNDTLMIHVLFNLLKNALYYIASASKGEIYIDTALGDKFNFLYFKDTGQGIEPKHLSQIFNRFFSTTLHGAGIGLAYCKLVMQNMGGDIQCDSVKGEYTLFKLTFPKKHS